jgi:AraC-like DNA-binding protein
MHIDAAKPVATCCVFFARGFVEGVYGSLTYPDMEPAGCTPSFLSCLHPQDNRILPRMQAIADATGRAPLWMDQQYLLLARDLLVLQEEARRQIRRLPAARESTRAEAFRRLCRGREFLHANLDQPLTLDRIARAACLSAYHFHRLFTKTFGESPHAYLTRIRLDRARSLILRHDRPLIEICGEVGFQSLGSFTTLFRRKFGAPPGAFRKLARFEKQAGG